MFRNQQVLYSNTSNSRTELAIFLTQKLISSTRPESSLGSQASLIIFKYIYFDQIQFNLYSLGQNEQCSDLF